ncbi:MAG: hypothetical protein OEY01_05425 [Desulfobulbaceae bacterium]|nr:hypothetical protein [Desulfobulbaceae bacterium]
MAGDNNTAQLDVGYFLPIGSEKLAEGHMDGNRANLRNGTTARNGLVIIQLLFVADKLKDSSGKAQKTGCRKHSRGVEKTQYSFMI